MSLGQKVKGSFGAMFFGFILIIASIGGTWLNEGRTIKTHKGLEQGAKSVYSSPTIDYVSPENEGNLVHVAGGVTTTDFLTDSDFGLESPYLKLKRSVEMYQWHEDKDTKKNENSEEKITTFSYKKVWSEKVRDSQGFNEASTHQNPTEKRFVSFSKTVSNASIGAHKLNANQIGQLNNWASLKLSEINLIEDVQLINSEGKSSEIYVGKTSLTNPDIGDLRIGYKTVYEGDYSVIAKQVGPTFEPFSTKRETTIDLVKSGIHSAESMFKEEISQNKFVKWMLRGLGFITLFIGIRMLFSVITLFTNQVPILRSIVNFGISLFAGIIAFCVFFIVAGIAWIFYRPVIGISLLVIGIGTLLFFSQKGKKMKSKIADNLVQQG
jgi:hypothetical protein